MKISLTFEEVKKIVARELLDRGLVVVPNSGAADTVTHGQYDEQTTEFVGISFDLEV